VSRGRALGIVEARRVQFATLHVHFFAGRRWALNFL